MDPNQDTSFSSAMSAENQHRLHHLPAIQETSRETSPSRPAEPLILPEHRGKHLRSATDLSSFSNMDKTSKLAYLIFFMLGVGMLYPWNVFITCAPYFEYRLRHSQYVDSFSNYFAVGFMSSNLLVLIALQWFRGNSINRMIISCLINTAVFVCCLALTVLDGMSADWFFGLNMVLVFVSGASVSYLQNGVFSIASLFPSIYTQSVMSGQGLAAIAVCISSLFSMFITETAKSRHKSGEDTQDVYAQFFALIYFGMAGVVLLLCLVGATYLQHTKIYQRHVGQNQSSYQQIAIDDDDLLKEDEEILIGTSEPKFAGINLTDGDKFRLVIGECWLMMVAVFLIYGTTLSVFPPLISLIQSVTAGSNENMEIYFVPVAFLAFALGDWLGKSAPGFPALHITDRFKIDFSAPRSARWIFTLSVLRLAFIPLFYMCNVIFKDQTRTFPTIITSDMLYLFILFTFAVSNGWLGSLAMIHGPQLSNLANNNNNGDVCEYDACTLQELKQKAGTFMILSLTFGLAVGSALSFPITQFA